MSYDPGDEERRKRKPDVKGQASLFAISGVAPRPGPHFNGSDYEPEHDHARLTGQILRVFECISDGAWRTLDEIAAETGDPHASVSAQLRNLRKERFGEHVIEKRSRGDRSHGLWEYRLDVDGEVQR